MKHRILIFAALFCFSMCLGGSLWAQSATFEIILFDGGPDAKVIDSDGNSLGTLPTQMGTGWGGWPSSLSDDRSRLLFVNWPWWTGPEVWLYDVKAKKSRKVTDAPWCQTLKWLPASSSKFVYAMYGSLYLYDLDTETSILWQRNDTIPYNTYRQGIDWDARFDKVVFQAGYYGAGGDAVFIGRYSEDDPNHHITDIQFLSNPSNGSSDWSNVAYYPLITSDGNTVYYGRRTNYYHALIRRDLMTGEDQVLKAATAPYPAGVNEPLFLYRDTQLLLLAPSETVPGSRALFVCTTNPFACREVYVATDIPSAIAVDSLLRDITPPTIVSATAEPAILWPPNHEMVPVSLNVSATDLVDPNPTCSIAAVSGDDGADASDWEVTGDLTLQLRAERSGGGNGRTYTITVACRDVSGNQATRSAPVSVPHDERKP